MTDSSALIANERIKFSSSIGGNVGAALFAAVFGAAVASGATKA